MNFISYAQNFEDVMLWRALKHIEHGFYIDVGANDPSIDSVTKAFYERGWTGINIEPLSSHFADLEQERPLDINLCCAVGAENGEIEIWECDVRGWATASETTVNEHSDIGHTGGYHTVPLRTLADICEQHVRREINFLKVDVEGFEKYVLEGMNFVNFRPWVIIVEATRPNSQIMSHEEWEDILNLSDYMLVYADGLNRFYLAAERRELTPFFQFPPNVFDEFIRSEQFDAELLAQQAEVKAQQIEEKVKQAEAELQSIYNSFSWRITIPLRLAKRYFSRLARGLD